MTVTISVKRKTSKNGIDRYQASCSEGDFKSKRHQYPGHAQQAAFDHASMKHGVPRDKVHTLRYDED